MKNLPENINENLSPVEKKIKVLFHNISDVN